MATKEKSRKALAISSALGIRAAKASRRNAKSQMRTKPKTLKQQLAYEAELDKKIKPGEIYELTEEDCKNVVPCHIFVGGIRVPERKSKH